MITHLDIHWGIVENTAGSITWEKICRKECLKARQAFFVQLVCGLSHNENIFTLNIQTLSHIYFTYVHGLLLCSFPHSKWTHWQLPVKLLCSFVASPVQHLLISHRIGESAGRIKPKCHSLVVKMTLSLPCVVVNYSQSCAPQVIYALWSFCCMSVNSDVREREGKGEMEGEKTEGRG